MCLHFNLNLNFIVHLNYLLYFFCLFHHLTYNTLWFTLKLCLLYFNSFELHIFKGVVCKKSWFCSLIPNSLKNGHTVGWLNNPKVSVFDELWTQLRLKNQLFSQTATLKFAVVLSRKAQWCMKCAIQLCHFLIDAGQRWWQSLYYIMVFVAVIIMAGLAAVVALIQLSSF